MVPKKNLRLIEMTTSYRIIFKNIVWLSCLAIFFALTSCEEDLAEVNAKKNKNFPSQIIHNANIIQRDSGFVKIRAKIKLLEKFELIDTPYVVARKGIYLEFYDKKKPKIPGKLWADFAKVIEKKEFYEARGNVKVINQEGQTFAMQSVFWDKKNRKMYTNDTVFISDKDGNIFVAAGGMNAKDDFSEYILYKNSGNFDAKKIPNTGK